MTCSQCRNQIVVDEMSDAERIACPSCGTEVHVRVGAVAEPPRRPTVPPSPIRLPIMPPVMTPVAPSRSPIRPPIMPARSEPPAQKAPLRSCPACSAKLALRSTTCDACGANYLRALRVARGEPESDDPDPFRTQNAAIEKAAMDSGVAVGAAVSLLGAVWFALGLAANRIFFYAPVLFVMGLIGVLNGIGNMSRKRKRGRPRGRYRD